MHRTYRAIPLGESTDWVYGGYYKHLPYTTGRTIPPDTDYEHYIIKSVLSEAGVYRGIEMVRVHPSTVCGCTGIRNLTGDLIYEYDLVGWEDRYGDKHVDTVRWCSDEGYWYAGELSGHHLARTRNAGINWKLMGL